jgi:hypothetical protein
MGQCHEDSTKSSNATHTHKYMFNETTIWTFLFDGQN